MGGIVVTQAVHWKLAGASVIGKQHEDAGGRCEDAWAKVHRRAPSGHEILAVCISDGAGSACKGRQGAQMTSRLVATWLADDFEKVFDSQADDCRRSLSSCVRRVIRRAAERERLSLKSYASTVVAVAVASDGRWIAVHLGDGAIVGRFNGALRPISLPKKGEFANETFFVTDDDASKCIEIRSSAEFEDSGAVTAFALFTDGMEANLINRHTAQLAPALNYMFDWLLNNTEEEVTKALEEQIESVFRQKTGDDCSLAMVVKETTQTDAVGVP